VWRVAIVDGDLAVELGIVGDVAKFYQDTLAARPK
jgi:hypothetical protein